MKWIPSVEVESNAGVREVTLETRHLMKRRVFLTGHIDMELVNNVISQLMWLEESGEEPINLYISSPGGEVNAGLLLYDVIQGMKTPINMYCMGMAASMAALILAGGQKGRRFILPHSKTMIHEPLISDGVGGTATSIRNISESILETKKIVNGILAKHTGKTIEEIDKATAYDHYMNAQESIAFGICDKVCESSIY
ncbi:MAG: ATP-dependent Clp protease proteolytic subunit [Lachnospiraceae bacterium]|nr:ATP-dependent Clp protease proteolytic subunit [Lachnospiraceae bacterium]